ncbi:ETS-related transcription factor Elf-4-like [Paramuricea clavata]|uniref:ETS-related transcription factor Elf-4-like n=1 Tax=Paramuricea clavata TaxID=317549 RepID=A0A6S7HU20_PARCT|nr:ETS-related transcription factor Elf-4-like [Paramuricea clavata]
MSGQELKIATQLDILTFQTARVNDGSASRKKSHSRSSTRKSLYLWEFLFGLLEDEECTSVITWTNKREGIFELKNTEELAKLWGTVKNRPRMDKSKLIRAIRTYYERGMLRKVKGHKGVYQFLSIPYRTKGYDHEMMTTGTFTSSPFLGSSERSLVDFNVITSDCSDRQPYYRGTTADGRDNTENNRDISVDDCKQTEDTFDKSNGYCSREKRWSDYSLSSDGSTKSLDERQGDFNTNTDTRNHMPEHMAFVFNDDDNVCR